MSEKTFKHVEDLDVYRMLCDLHIELCELTKLWPAEERFELGSQIRRSSNSSPSQLAEKNDDRHVRNKIEGVNRSRGEVGETVHHLYIALRKNYVKPDVYNQLRGRYRECIKMLNGLERSLERHLPSDERKWAVRETPPESYTTPDAPNGFPDT